MPGLTKRQMSIDGVVHISSNAYTTGCQGGGDKKAGLVPTKNVPYGRWISLAVAQTRNTQMNTTNPVVFGLKHTVNPYTQQSRPVGSTPQYNSYFKTGAQCCNGRSIFADCCNHHAIHKVNRAAQLAKEAAAIAAAEAA
jgi:hypothetical protein